MRCAECPHWQTVPTNGSSRGDAEMEQMGYRNCCAGTDSLGLIGTFLHGNTICRNTPADFLVVVQ